MAELALPIDQKEAGIHRVLPRPTPQADQGNITLPIDGPFSWRSDRAEMQGMDHARKVNAAQIGCGDCFVDKGHGAMQEKLAVVLSQVRHRPDPGLLSLGGVQNSRPSIFLWRLWNEAHVAVVQLVSLAHAACALS